ncbi:hypothetical protein A6R71_09060 [Xanthomonas translucens pv. arrhenatheri]|nr:hypothetical protein A6R71_09060 [Xanthomonas translucens pv. arrhenatheri]
MTSRADGPGTLALEEGDADDMSAAETARCREAGAAAGAVAARAPSAVAARCNSSQLMPATRSRTSR